MKTIVLLFFACCLMISCTGNVENGDLKKINLNPYDSSKMLIEDLSDSTFFIPLNQKKGFKVDNIDQLYITKDRIIVAQHSKSSILIFDREGEPVLKIQNIGKGPGQFEHIQNVIFNEKKQELEIFDKGLSKISRYNLLGKFIADRAIRQGKNTGYNLFGNNDIYVSQLFYNNYDKRWIGIHKNNELIIDYVASALRIPPIARKLDMMFSHQLDTYKDSLFYFPLLDDKIYSININGAKPVYQIDLPEKNKMDASFLDQKPFGGYKIFLHKMKQTDFIFNNDCLFISDKYVFFRYNFKAEFQVRNVIYSKKSGKVKQYTEYYSKYYPSLRLLSLVRAKYEDYLVTDVHPTQYGNLPWKVQEKIGKEGNPVLMFLKLKDF